MSFCNKNKCLPLNPGAYTHITTHAVVSTVMSGVLFARFLIVDYVTFKQ